MCAVMVAAGAASAQTFVNGNFETGNLSGWTVTPTANGQTRIQDTFLYDIDGGGPLGPSQVARFAVGQVAFQSGVPAGIELTQSINLAGGTAYVISFDWSAYRESSTVSNAQGGIFDLIVNGVAIASGVAGSTSLGTPRFGSVSGNFLAPANGGYSVGVRITRPFTPPDTGGPITLFQAVDNFTIIPAPGALALMGLAGLAGTRRRR
jgi:uncharacterized protein (TIGR03382 family)